MEWAEPSAHLAPCQPSCRWDWPQTKRNSKKRTRPAGAAWSRAPAWLLLPLRGALDSWPTPAASHSLALYAQLLGVTLCPRASAPSPRLPPAWSFSLTSLGLFPEPQPSLVILRRSQLCYPGLAGSHCPPTALQDPAPGGRRPPFPSSKFHFDL